MKFNADCKVLLIFLTFMKVSVYAQVPFFETSFGQAGADIAFSVKQNPDSNLYVFGYSQSAVNQSVDFALSKLSPSGTLYWTKYYGTPDVDFGLNMNLADSFNLVLVGVVETTSNLGQEVLLIKVDSAGQEIWRHTYGGVGNQSCKFVQKTSDGGYIMCGYASDSFGANDNYVLKVDGAGNFMWDSTYGGTDIEYASRILEMPGNSFVMSADTRSYGSGGFDAMLSKIDATGFEFWNAVHGDQFQNGCQGFIKTSADVFVVWGETEIFQNSYFDFFQYMFDSDGNYIRQSVFGGAGADAMFDLVETPNGDFMATGYSNSQSGGQQPINVAIVRTDSLGNLLWSREYGDSSIDIGYNIIPALGGGYYVAGRITLADEEFYLMHIDENGLTGIEQPTSERLTSLTVFPNPADGFCRLESGFEVDQWRITDMSGRQVMKLPGTMENRKTLSTSSLSTGSYLVEASGKGRKSIAKLLIVR